MKIPVSILFLLFFSLATYAQTTYPIVWTNPINVTVNADNSLTKSGGGNNWNAGIVSQNVLLPSEDGYLEFTFPGGTNNIYMVSLTKLNNDVNHQSSDYSLYVNQSQFRTHSLGSALGGAVTLVAGNVYRVAREGSEIKFYINGTLLRTIALTNALDYLRADVSIYAGSVPVITSSFQKALMVKPQFQFPGAANDDGSITLQMEGTVDPMTYSWSSGESTASIAAKARGTYTVTATDASSRMVTKTYGLGYPVTWTNKVSVTVNASNALTHTGTAGWGTAGASSTNVLPPNTDGWMEFVVNEPSSVYMIGLSRFDNDQDRTSINYGWYMNGLGTSLILENGVNQNVLSSLMKGDVFRVAREGSDIKYYLNGAVMRTTPVDPAVSLLVDASLYNNWGPTAVVSTSFPPLPAQAYPITWSNPINVIVNGDNSLSKSGGAAGAWDAGIVSQNMLNGGSDGYLQFTYAGGTNNYAVSLSRSNNDPHYQYGDFSLFVNQSTLHLMVSNSTLQTAALVAGDVLKISREGGNIVYYKNGVALRTVALSSYNQSVLSDYLRADVSIANGDVPPITSSFALKLVVKSTIQVPTQADNDGSIAIQLEGNIGSVTYTWSSGETSSSIASKARDSYTVTVQDQQGQSISRSYGLGFPVAWTNTSNVSINPDNTLSKSNAGEGWGTAGASSLNRLPANTNGWVEFVLNEPTAAFMIGLSKIDNGTDYTTIDYAWFLNKYGGLAIYESGTHRSYVGAMVKGDVVRLAREGTNIRYYVNGILKREVTGVPLTASFLVDVSIYNNPGPLPVITTSFEQQIRILPSITFPDASNALGSIALNVQGTYTPHTVSWSSGETSIDINNKSRGTYTVTISDAASRSVSRSYSLGYPIEWTDLQNATVNPDNSLAKTGSAAAFDASGISANILQPSADGWIECILPSSSVRTMFGLARMNAVTTYTAIDYAYYFYNNYVYIFELGVNRGIVAGQEEGSVYKIAREGTDIKYYINGTVVRAVATAPSEQLFVDVSIYEGASPRIAASFNRESQTYYSIANGPWTSPSTWSLSEGGSAADIYPGPGDIAMIKGYTVSVNSAITSGGINVIVTNENTSLKVQGAGAILSVKSNIKLQGGNNVSTAKALVVQDQAKINIEVP